MAERQIVEQISREDPRMEAYRIGMLKSAQELVNEPIDIPAYQVAGLSPYEIQAMRMAQQGIGSYQPYMQAGTQALGGAADAFGNISPIASDIARYGQQTMRGVQDYTSDFERLENRALGSAAQYGNLMTGQAAGTAGYVNALGQDIYGMGGQGARQMDAYAAQMGRTGQQGLNQALSFGGGLEALGGSGAAQMNRAGQQMSSYALQGANELDPYSARMAGLTERAAVDATGMGRTSADVGLGAIGETDLYQRQIGALGRGVMQNVPGMYDTGTTQQFMNPYQQAVTDQAVREINRQAAMGMNELRARTTAAGALGGSRGAIAEQEYARNVGDTIAKTIAEDTSRNYLQAQQAGMSAFEADRARTAQAYQQALAAQQLGGQMGMQSRETAMQGLGQGINAQLQGGQLALAGQQGAANLNLAGSQLGLSGLEAATQAGMQGLQYQMQGGQSQADLAMRAYQQQLAAQQAAAGTDLSGLQFGAQTAQTAADLGLQTGQQQLAAFQNAGALNQQGIQNASAANQAAVAAYLDAQRTGIGALQTSGQMYGSLGEAYGNLSSQYGNLGALGSQLGQEQSRYIATLGGVQREQAQQALDARRQTELARQYEPYQRLGFYNDILSRTPSAQSTISQTTAPGSSGLAGALGSGIQAYAMYQGMSNLWNNNRT